MLPGAWRRICRWKTRLVIVSRRSLLAVNVVFRIGYGVGGLLA
jgi:hypothetical protein